MLTVMRIEDEFGKYAGTAVVDGLKLRRTSHYLAGQTGHHPEPVCRVVRVWTDYDEVGAEMMAEGFIEGFGHGISETAGPALDMQISSMAPPPPDVTSPPPWEQGFEWDEASHGFARSTGVPGDAVEYIEATNEMMVAYNTWQNTKDRPGTNTR